MGVNHLLPLAPWELPVYRKSILRFQGSVGASCLKAIPVRMVHGRVRKFSKICCDLRTINYELSTMNYQP